MSSTPSSFPSTPPVNSTVRRLPPPPDKLATLIDKSKSINQILQIHAFLLRHNLNLNYHPILNFKLQRSYASLNRLDNAITLFNQTPSPNVFLYTNIIHYHTLNHLHHQALFYYSQMLLNNVQPNQFTLSSILKSCRISSAKCLHSQAIKFGYESDLYVRTNLLNVYAKAGDVKSADKLFVRMSERSLVSLTAMITSYAKHGELERARELFDELREKDVVCWNVMIDGYAQNGMANESLALFRGMLAAKVRPDEVTVLAVLSACGQIGASDSGRWVHSYIKNNGIQVNVRVGTALIDMYSKCGDLEDARQVFENLDNKDVVAWNSMIMGYAIHGFVQEALQLFNEMLMIGIQPSDITFIGVLTACANSGLVTEGRSFFKSMKENYWIEPKIEHYGCMMNLLGRAGQLEEAYDLVRNMKIKPDTVLWGTLLGACRQHGNVGLAEEVVEFLVENDLANSGTYVLLSNVYAAAGDWDGVGKVRALMKESGIAKEPGCSSIEVNNKIHEFLAGDLRHPNCGEIYTKLEEINGWLKDCGYTPQTETVLHDLEKSQREQSLAVHSEKLALAFGLISTRPGTTLKVVKNLRVCPDCHAVTKLLSKITGRKIVMRDRNRFHHFENGICSCRDYW
ncbi:hypothetical protein ACFE04_001182 [Oxalis oulophora]